MQPSRRRLPSTPHVPSSASKNASKTSLTSHTSTTRTPKNESSIAQLQDTLSFIIQQLQETYSSDATAAPFQKVLEEKQRQLNQNTLTQIASFEQQIIDAFGKSKNSSNDPFSTNSLFLNKRPYVAEKYSLIYLLDRAFTQAFPLNPKDSKGNLKAPQKEKETIKLQSIAPEDKNKLIPAQDRLVHFANFVIEESHFSWQDKICAIQFAQQNKIDFETKKRIVLPKNPQVEKDQECDLDLLDQSLAQTASTAFLSLERISFHYEMIFRGATQKTIYNWEEIFQNKAKIDLAVERKTLSDWIVHLSRYSTLLREKKYCTATKAQELCKEQQSLCAAILSNDLTKKYLGLSVESPVDQLNIKVSRVLSNIASSSISDAVHAKMLSLEDALKNTKKAANNLIAIHKYTTSEPGRIAIVKYKVLITDNIAKDDFTHFAHLMGFNDKEALNSLLQCCIARKTLEDINLLFSFPPALKDVNKHIEKGIINGNIFIEHPGSLANYICDVYPDFAKQNTPPYKSLDAFIENYNAHEAEEGTKISLNKEDKNSLAFLEDLSENFRDTLTHNSLAREVIYEKGNSDLLYFMKEYASLPRRLRALGASGDDKKDSLIDQIHKIAKAYCFNIKSEPVLNAIKISGLPIQDCLSLRDAMRNSIEKCAYDSYSQLRMLDPNEEKCEEFFYKVLGYICNNRASLNADKDNIIKPLLEENYAMLTDNLFIGLVRQGILFPDEILSLDRKSQAILYNASEAYSALRPEIKEEIKKVGVQSFSEIIYSTRKLEEARKQLNALQKGTSTEKTQYFEERARFFTNLTRLVELIISNLEGEHYTKSLLGLMKTPNINFFDIVVLSEKERFQIHKDAEHASLKFQRYEALAAQKKSCSKILPWTKHLSLEAVKDIIGANIKSIGPNQLYFYTTQLLEHLLSEISSPLLEQCYESDLLSIGQIARLDAQALDTLKANKKYLIEESQQNKGFIKHLFTRCLPKKGDITEKNIEDFNNKLAYLKSPLIRQILAQSNTDNPLLIESIINDQHSFEAFQRAEHALKKRFKKAYYASKTEIEHYEIFFSSIFLSDPFYQKSPGSFFDHILTHCGRYLDNLEDVLSKQLINLGMRQAAVLASTTEVRKNVAAQYKAFKSLLEEYLGEKSFNHNPNDSDSGQSHDDQTISPELKTKQLILKQLIQSDSLTHIAENIKSASQNLQGEYVQYLLDEKLDIFVAIQLPESLAKDIDLLLTDITREYSASNSKKKYHYPRLNEYTQLFNQYINGLFSTETTTPHTEILANKVKILKELPILIDLLRLHPEKMQDILHSLDERIDSAAINAILNSANEHPQIRNWIKSFGYKNLSHMIAEYLNDSGLPLNQLQAFLRALIAKADASARRAKERAGSRRPDRLDRLDRLMHAGGIPFFDILSVTENDIQKLSQELRHRVKGRVSTAQIKRDLQDYVSTMKEARKTAIAQEATERDLPSADKDSGYDTGKSPNLSDPASTERQRGTSGGRRHRDDHPPSRHSSRQSNRHADAPRERGRRSHESPPKYAEYAGTGKRPGFFSRLNPFSKTDRTYTPRRRIR